MGVRIVVGEGEPIGLALKRFRKAMARRGMDWEFRRYGLLVRSRGIFVDATEKRRAKRFRKRFKTRRAMLLARLAGVRDAPTRKKLLAKFWKRSGKP